MNCTNSKNIISCSMIVDNGNNNKDYNQLQNRPLLLWQEDTSVKKCSGCSSEFGYLTRRHHCRYCGYIYCNKCSSTYVMIPVFLKIPEPPRNYSENRNVPLRVCNYCDKKLSQLNILRRTIEVFNNIDISIKEIKVIAQVCNMWRQYANYYLSHFRTIQYELPQHVFTSIEKKILWMNREYFIGHNMWMTQLIKSIDYTKNNEKIHELLKLLDLHKNSNVSKRSCHNLMCTRKCNVGLNLETALMLCSCDILCSSIHEYALTYFDKLTVQELIQYIPYLIEQGLHSPFGKIHDWLINKAREDIEIANEIFWNIRTYSESNTISNKHNLLKQNWSEKVPIEYRTVIENGLKLVLVLEEYYNNKNDKTLDMIIKKLKRFSGYFVIPTNVKLTKLKLNYNNVIIKDSNTHPIILEFCDESTEKIYRILYKPEDIRKERTIMNVINTIDVLLKRDIGDLNIITYNIIPTSCQGGFIEIIENCETLYNITNSGQTILNHMIDKNPDTPPKIIRDKFLKSTAAYSAITYVLGVGDRHLDNIMITSDGKLFHIDYGFILGKDPKFMNNCNMRISEDTVDALGCQNSENFKNFKELCADKIYNSLRRHVNLIFCLLSVLATSNPKIYNGTKNIITFDEIYQEINKKLVPGESYHQAKIQFYDHIDNSTSHTFVYSVVDKIHSSSKNGILGHFNNLFGITGSYIKGFFNNVIIPDK